MLPEHLEGSGEAEELKKGGLPVPFYVHITEGCREDAGRHGLREALERLAEKVERERADAKVTDGPECGFRPFLRRKFWKKPLGRNFRLVAFLYEEEREDKRDALLVFASVFVKSGEQYDDMLERESFEQVRLVCGVPDDAVLAEILRGRRCCGEPQLPPPPSEVEERWLWGLHWKEESERDWVILESEEWVSGVKARRDWLVKYREIVERLLVVRPALSEAAVAVSRDANLGAWFSRDSEQKRLFLLAPVFGNDDGGESGADYAHLLGEHGPEVLLRRMRRAYPAFMVLDEEAWLEIEKDEEANLALSPEEARILEGLRFPGASPEGPALPLFINGRAGSGKSTMLHYLAAEYLFFALQEESGLAPIFTTSSIGLLEHARDRVKRICTTRYDHLCRRSVSGGFAHRMDNLLQQSFVVFREHLLRLLPEERRKAFPPETYVDYPTFLALWNREVRHPEARRISPEVAWHTIRTYIKGRRSSLTEVLTPADFAQLPRRVRSVSQSVFDAVYEHVWRRWYAGKTGIEVGDGEGFWDDQDLAAEVLFGEGIPESFRYPAVFCDEAQDFTALELQIVVDSSLFASRTLSPEQFRMLPFLFAGDPLQTINPTGFRWDALGAEFHEKFRPLLDPRRRNEAKVDFQELTFNYRSNRGIVGFGNLISLVRHALLSLPEAFPQRSWWFGAKEDPLFFDVNDPAVRDYLCRRTDLVKIIDCAEGEESLVAGKDPLLRRLPQENGVYQNVLSPARAKGLEFGEVVLYCFGANPPELFRKVLEGLHAGEGNSSEESEALLPVEYFLNRLYVAATRPKRRLFVVDDRAAFDSFWRFAREAELVDGLIRGYAKTGRTAERWKEGISCLLPGRSEAWEGVRIDPLELAREYETQGRKGRDSYLMRQAAIAYRNVPDEVRSLRCTALAHEFDGDLRHAGELYLRLNDPEKAFDCFWRGKHFGEICRMTALSDLPGRRMQARAADFMEQRQGQAAPFLESLTPFAGEREWRREVLRDATWRSVFVTLAERLATLRGDVAAAVLWCDADEIFSCLVADGLSEVSLRHVALLAYRAGRLSRAVALWEQVGQTGIEEYWRARAELDPFPHNLSWLVKAREMRRVVEAWRASGWCVERADSDVGRAVFEAACTEKEWSLALGALHANPDRLGTERLLREFLARKDLAALVDAAAVFVRLLVREREWEKACRMVDLVECGEFRSVSAEALCAALGSDPLCRLVLLDALLREVGRAEEVLAGDRGHRRDALLELLRSCFVEPWQAGMRPCPEVPLRVVGAAVECMGIHVLALQLYRAVLRSESPASEEERLFARKRLCRVLGKFAYYLEGRRSLAQSASEEGMRYFEEIPRVQMEIAHLESELGLRMADLPEFVSVPGFEERLRLKKLQEARRLAEEEAREAQEKETAEVDAQVRDAHEGEAVSSEDGFAENLSVMPKGKSGPFAFSTSADGKKVRVEYVRLFETVTFDVEQQVLRGDAIVHRFHREGVTKPEWEVLPAWEIPEWKTRLFLREEQGSYVLLVVGEEGELRIPLPAREKKPPELPSGPEQDDLPGADKPVFQAGSFSVPGLSGRSAPNLLFRSGDGHGPKKGASS
jgi:hypothetical protein